MWTMLYVALELLRESVWAFVWWGVVYPVTECVATPIILLAALFQHTPYRRAVSELFTTVHAFCIRGYWLLA